MLIVKYDHGQLLEEPMNNTKILILNGHPGQASLSRAIADTYAKAATEAGHFVRRHDLSDMQFDMDFGQSDYRAAKKLEPSLETFMEDLNWADHFVLATPLWWGGLPAKLKGLFDRAFLPGLAFDPRTVRAGFPKPLLVGKSARVVMTSDTPMWVMRLFYRRAIQHQLTGQILKFVGITPTRYSHFAPIKDANPDIFDGWLDKVAVLGGKAA